MIGRREMKRRSFRSGLSLLEVVFAIAILGTALAAIGQLVQQGMRAGGAARVQSYAQILADAKMAEVASEILPLSSTSGSPIDDAPGWVYSVDVQPAEQIGLLVVRVTVQQSSSDRPIEFSVVRFMPDPNFEFNDPSAEQ
jgi:type II secretion system protein I